MNTKAFLRIGVPLAEATRRATDFVSKFVLGGGDQSRLREAVTATAARRASEGLMKDARPDRDWRCRRF